MLKSQELITRLLKTSHSAGGTQASTHVKDTALGRWHPCRIFQPRRPFPQQQARHCYKRFPNVSEVFFGMSCLWTSSSVDLTDVPFLDVSSQEGLKGPQRGSEASTRLYEHGRLRQSIKERSASCEVHTLHWASRVASCLPTVSSRNSQVSFRTFVA